MNAVGSCGIRLVDSDEQDAGCEYRSDLRPAAPEHPADRRVVEPDPARAPWLAGLVDVVADLVDQEVGEDGNTVSATTSEASSANVTVSENDRKN